MALDDNITLLSDFARDALSRAASVSGRINTFTPNISAANLAYTPNVPQMAKPASLTDFLPVDNSNGTLEFINSETEALIDQYFPEITGALRYAPEQWLVGIITGQQPLGLSKEVFEAVWHQSRDREYRARNSAIEQVRAEFSQRGFSLPPGAMVKAIIRMEEQASDAIGDVNRSQTVRDAEIKLDLLKFAQSQALQLKTGIFQAIASYYQVLMELPNKDIEASRMKVAAYSSLNDAMSQYYRVQLGFEELRLQAASLRMNGKLDENRLRVAAVDGSRNAAFGQATSAFASAAEGAINAAGTLQARIETGE